MSKPFLLYSLALMLFTLSCTHKLSNGIYKGTELISAISEIGLWPGVFEIGSKVDKLGRHWFHEVTIKIENDSAIIIKRPFYIKDGEKAYSDSLGGFYNYYKDNIEYDKQDKTFTIFCRLERCAYCPTLATATPLYTYERYEIVKRKRTLIVKTHYEKNLIFHKQ